MKTIGRFTFLLLLFCSASATYADTFGSDANTFDIEFVTISFRVASIALPEPERCCWGRWRPWDCRGGATEHLAAIRRAETRCPAASGGAK